MVRPIDTNDLENALDLLRNEVSAVQDKALKLVDKKLGTMITAKTTVMVWYLRKLLSSQDTTTYLNK